MKKRSKIILGIFVAAVALSVPWYKYCNTTSDGWILGRGSDPAPWQHAVCFGQLSPHKHVESAPRENK
ncbi:MAG: hypothetical protein ACAH80_04615 [Alphaproteobacteria bacterium]